MSKSEKRYFTLDSNKGNKKSKKYLDLFHSLNDMEQYNEPKLKRKFTKNLSSDKSYLYEAIMRSMRDYRSPKSKSSQIKERLQDSRYLYEMGLYKQSDLRLKEAQQLASQLGDQLMLLEVAKERLHTAQVLDKEQIKKRLDDLNQQRHKALNFVNQYFEYSKDYYETLQELSDAQRMQKTEKIENSKLLIQEDTLNESPLVRRRYFQSKALSFQLVGDLNRSVHYYRQTLHVWSQYPSLIEEDTYGYIQDITSLCYSLLTTKLYGEATKAIELLEAVDASYPHERKRQTTSVIKLKLSLWYDTLDYPKAEKQLGYFEDSICQYEIMDDAELNTRMGIMYFELKDFKSGYHWFNLCLKINSESNPFQLISRYLNLICLFEMDEFDMLINAQRALQRYIKNNKLLGVKILSELNPLLFQIFKAFPFDRNTHKFQLADLLKQRLATHENFRDIIEPMLRWAKG